MNRTIRPSPRRFAATVLCAWLCGAGLGAAARAGEFSFFHEEVMGTSLELRVRADGAESARRAEGRALGEIACLAAIFSNHDATSEFRRWQAGPPGPRAVSAELREILRAADDWRARSRGAFDPRVEILSRLWAGCAARGRMPTADELAGARAFLSRDAWRMDPASGTAERLSDGPLSLDGIAKGYIVESACRAALDGADGVRGLLLNVGGDLRACGEAPWAIGLAPPRDASETSEPTAFLDVRDRSVSTSGSAQRGWRIGGRWYSHILDPGTGRPVERVLAATVVAPRGADADALATILNVLPVEDGLRLVDATPEAASRVVTSDGRIARSLRWGQYERPGPPTLTRAGGQAAPAPQPGGSWGDEFELVVHFETNRPQGTAGPYRRPYVVIWAEGENGIAVRNLLVWVSLGGAGPDQWLPELTRWYRGDAAHSPADRKGTAYTIGRPTRPPGTYSVVWDGTDDKERPVARGKYTIFIEAAREHGTHQLIRKQVDLADRPFVEELTGNVEIRAASIEYRRKAAAR
jgi:thiamine biosynthesis lipoprotein ApbE